MRGFFSGGDRIMHENMEGAERCCVIVGRLFLVHSKVSNMRMSVCLHACACTHTSMSIVWFSCNLSLLIHPSYKYLLCTSFVPGTALGLKNIAIDKSEKKFLPPWSLHSMGAKN